jgi:hypothetical protein
LRFGKTNPTAIGHLGWDKNGCYKPQWVWGLHSSDQSNKYGGVIFKRVARFARHSLKNYPSINTLAKHSGGVLKKDWLLVSIQNTCVDVLRLH